MKQAFFNQSGFTLLEVLVAITILAIGLLGIAGMMIVPIRSNVFSHRMTIATNLIQDKIEEMKNMAFDDLFKPQVDDPNLSDGSAPVDMIDIDVPNGGTQTVVTPVQKGNVWEYRLNAVIEGVVYNRTWTVERNPDIDGDGLTYPADANEGRTLKVGGMVTWRDGAGKDHTITLYSIISE